MDATPHIIESALLLLVAFLLGCVIGYFARRASGQRPPAAAPAPLAADTPAPTSEASVSQQSVADAPVGKAPRAGRSAAVKGSAQTARKRPAKAKSPALPDDLKKIRGIGPRLEAALNSHGINRYAQIAKWSKKTIAELDADLSLRGRIEREQWVEQAKALDKPAK